LTERPWKGITNWEQYRCSTSYFATAGLLIIHISTHLFLPQQWP